MTETAMNQQVVMTPKCKTANSTVLIIERRAVTETNDKMHVAGGDHKGIVINKEAIANGDASSDRLAQLSLEFRVFLVSAQTGKHTQESRTLRFWFTEGLNDKGAEQAHVAQEFFRELVSPQEFPRDYVGFIKKIMKLMQHGYPSISKVEVELRQLQEEVTPPPTRPLSSDDSILVTVITIEKVLELIESAYPNPVTIQDIAANQGWTEEEVTRHLSELQERGLVRAMENGAFARAQQEAIGHEVTIVRQMPTVASNKQPTIAIITAQYCEKLAVDAMIENKETYVRFTTVGESNVYTLGCIGAHRVVCTKLPSVGHTREAMTAAGNTTTRLLGTFQKVDYVFLVGVAGGVPHYTDYNRHVRLGDVVVSCPTENNGSRHVYMYCESVSSPSKTEEAKISFELRPYAPVNLVLQNIARDLKVAADNNADITPPWLKYMNQGLSTLTGQSEHEFKPPPVESDKLYMNIGERDVIEVAHPAPQDSFTKRMEGCPRVHLAPVASGRQVVRDDRLRQKFASQTGALAYDCEFDAVIESVLGNCRESFVCVRGISDYKDGMRRREWQPYASLAAASVMKAVICGMKPPTDV